VTQDGQKFYYNHVNDAVSAEHPCHKHFVMKYQTKKKQAEAQKLQATANEEFVVFENTLSSIYAI
jgi:hypothetical protein